MPRGNQLARQWQLLQLIDHPVGIAVEDGNFGGEEGGGDFAETCRVRIGPVGRMTASDSVPLKN